MTASREVVIVVMGVAGAGKTTVGRLLAKALGAGFAEGDDYHPPANVAKMQGGIALDDADRAPWLAAMDGEIESWCAEDKTVVLACSALKRRYRDLLRGGRPDVVFVYLKGTESLIRARLAARRGHFMPPALLASQFAALEEPGADEAALTVEIGEGPAAVAETILARLEQYPIRSNR